MRSIMMLAAFLLFAVAQDALACPATNGTNPRADMKVALDYYSGINASEIIATADCALKQFEVSQQFEQAYKAEKSTLNYKVWKIPQRSRRPAVSCRRPCAANRRRQRDRLLQTRYSNPNRVRVTCRRRGVGHLVARRCFLPRLGLPSRLERLIVRVCWRAPSCSKPHSNAPVKQALTTRHQWIYTERSSTHRPHALHEHQLPSGSYLNWKRLCCPARAGDRVVDICLMAARRLLLDFAIHRAFASTSLAEKYS
jgi:hypothetical protein